MVREASFHIIILSHFLSHIYRSHILLLVYGIEAVLPVEIEMGSLRVALEQQISEASGPSRDLINFAC